MKKVCLLLMLVGTALSAPQLIHPRLITAPKRTTTETSNLIFIKPIYSRQLNFTFRVHQKNPIEDPVFINKNLIVKPATATPKMITGANDGGWIPVQIVTEPTIYLPRINANGIFSIQINPSRLNEIQSTTNPKFLITNKMDTTGKLADTFIDNNVVLKATTVSAKVSDLVASVTNSKVNTEAFANAITSNPSVVGHSQRINSKFTSGLFPLSFPHVSTNPPNMIPVMVITPQNTHKDDPTLKISSTPIKSTTDEFRAATNFLSSTHKTDSISKTSTTPIIEFMDPNHTTINLTKKSTADGFRITTNFPSSTHKSDSILRNSTTPIIDFVNSDHTTIKSPTERSTTKFGVTSNFLSSTHKTSKASTIIKLINSTEESTIDGFRVTPNFPTSTHKNDIILKTTPIVKPISSHHKPGILKSTTEKSAVFAITPNYVDVPQITKTPIEIGSAVTSTMRIEFGPKFESTSFASTVKKVASRKPKIATAIMENDLDADLKTPIISKGVTKKFEPNSATVVTNKPKPIESDWSFDLVTQSKSKPTTLTETATVKPKILTTPSDWSLEFVTESKSKPTMKPDLGGTTIKKAATTKPKVATPIESNWSFEFVTESKSKPTTAKSTTLTETATAKPNILTTPSDWNFEFVTESKSKATLEPDLGATTFKKTVTLIPKIFTAPIELATESKLKPTTAKPDPESTTLKKPRTVKPKISTTPSDWSFEFVTESKSKATLKPDLGGTTIKKAATIKPKVSTPMENDWSFEFVPGSKTTLKPHLGTTAFNKAASLKPKITTPLETDWSYEFVTEPKTKQTKKNSDPDLETSLESTSRRISTGKHFPTTTESEWSFELKHLRPTRSTVEHSTRSDDVEVFSKLVPIKR